MAWMTIDVDARVLLMTMKKVFLFLIRPRTKRNVIMALHKVARQKMVLPCAMTMEKHEVKARAQTMPSDSVMKITLHRFVAHQHVSLKKKEAGDWSKGNAAISLLTILFAIKQKPRVLLGPPKNSEGSGRQSVHKMVFTLQKRNGRIKGEENPKASDMTKDSPKIRKENLLGLNPCAIL